MSNSEDTRSLKSVLKRLLQAAVFIAAVAIGAPNASADNEYEVSPGDSSDTAHVPYSPPTPLPEPIMRAPTPWDRALPDNADNESQHDLEDEETTGRSRGEENGQDEETPEPPAGE